MEEMIMLLTLQKQAELSKGMCITGKIMCKLTPCRDEPQEYGNRAGMKTQEDYPTMERWKKIKTEATLHLMHCTLQ